MECDVRAEDAVTTYSRGIRTLVTSYGNALAGKENASIALSINSMKETRPFSVVLWARVSIRDPAGTISLAK